MPDLEIIIPGGFVVATFVGLLTGVFGIGGGFLMTPALIIFLGVPGPTAVGTGLATILTTSSFAILRRRRTQTVDFKLALTIAVGALVGITFGFCGLEALKHTPPLAINGRELDTVTYVLLCSSTLLLILIAGYLYFDHRRTSGQFPQKMVGLLAAVRLPPYTCYRSLDEPRLSVTVLVLLGISVGMLTGLLGISGGITLLPALIYLVGQRPVKAAGTSLLIVWISSLIAVAVNSRFGNINVHLWATMTAGGLVGVFFGTKIGLNAPGARLRFYLIYVVLTALVLIGYKLVDMTFG